MKKNNLAGYVNCSEFGFRDRKAQNFKFSFVLLCLAIMEFELQTLHLPGRHSATRATPPAFTFLFDLLSHVTCSACVLANK
jgi:hypothetical protein